jgi:hypothetical protein
MVMIYCALLLSMISAIGSIALLYRKARIGTLGECLLLCDMRCWIYVGLLMAGMFLEILKSEIIGLLDNVFCLLEFFLYFSTLCLLLFFVCVYAEEVL